MDADRREEENGYQGQQEAREYRGEIARVRRHREVPDPPETDVRVPDRGDLAESRDEAVRVAAPHANQEGGRLELSRRDGLIDDRGGCLAVERIGVQVLDNAHDFAPSARSPLPGWTTHEANAPAECGAPTQNCSYEGLAHDHMRSRPATIRGAERASGEEARAKDLEVVGGHAPEIHIAAGRGFRDSLDLD